MSQFELNIWGYDYEADLECKICGAKTNIPDTIEECIELTKQHVCPGNRDHVYRWDGTVIQPKSRTESPDTPLNSVDRILDKVYKDRIVDNLKSEAITFERLYGTIQLPEDTTFKIRKNEDDSSV